MRVGRDDVLSWFPSDVLPDARVHGPQILPKWTQCAAGTATASQPSDWVTRMRSPKRDSKRPTPRRSVSKTRSKTPKPQTSTRKLNSKRQYRNSAASSRTLAPNTETCIFVTKTRFQTRKKRDFKHEKNVISNTKKT